MKTRIYAAPAVKGLMRDNPLICTSSTRMCQGISTVSHVTAQYPTVRTHLYHSTPLFHARKRN